MEGPDRLRVSWSLPSVPGPLVGDGFLLRLWDGARRQERRENVSSPQARTTLLTGLTPGTHYQLDVRLYHCTLLGPASPPARVLLPLSGMLEKGRRAQSEDRGHMRPKRTWEVTRPGWMWRKPRAHGKHGHRRTYNIKHTWTWGGHGTGATQGIGGHEEDLGLLVCKENKGKQKLKGEGDHRERKSAREGRRRLAG